MPTGWIMHIIHKTAHPGFRKKPSQETMAGKPAAGFGCGLLTVLLVILIASRLDAGFQNHTIILFGKNSTTQNPCVLC